MLPHFFYYPILHTYLVAVTDFYVSTTTKHPIRFRVRGILAASDAMSESLFT